MRERFAELQLNETQKQEMASLMGIYGPRFKEMRERGAADRRALLLAAPDAPDYRDLTERVSVETARAAAEAVVLLAELQANAYALLDPEQQATYRRLKEQAEERRQACARKESSDTDCSRIVHHGRARIPGAHGKPPLPPQ